MIRWCSYCQAFLGECPPYDLPDFTHGICTPCVDRLARDEPLAEDTEPVRALFDRILASARDGDEPACAALVAQARTLGLGAESLLVGMLQPVLYRAGLEWQGGRMSVVAEHRLTRWCERAFALLAPSRRGLPPIDLLIFQTPGNTHTIGPRFAAQALAARGLTVEVVTPAVPFEEMVTVARELSPRFVGFSCSLPASVAVACDCIGRLRERLEPELGARYLVAGFALRGGACAPQVPPGIEVARDLEFFGPARAARELGEAPGT